MSIILVATCSQSLSDTGGVAGGTWSQHCLDTAFGSLAVERLRFRQPAPGLRNGNSETPAVAVSETWSKIVPGISLKIANDLIKLESSLTVTELEDKCRMLLLLLRRRFKCKTLIILSACRSGGFRTCFDGDGVCCG